MLSGLHQEFRFTYLNGQTLRNFSMRERKEKCIKEMRNDEIQPIEHQWSKHLMGPPQAKLKFSTHGHLQSNHSYLDVVGPQVPTTRTCFRAFPSFRLHSPSISLPSFYLPFPPLSYITSLSCRNELIGKKGLQKNLNTRYLCIFLIFIIDFWVFLFFSVTSNGLDRFMGF